MQLLAMAMARWVLPVPVPPTSTALRCWAMKPPPARSCTSVGATLSMFGELFGLAPHPIEKIGPDQHAEAAAGIGERRRVPPGIIGVRWLSQFLELLLGFTSLVFRSFWGDRRRGDTF